MNLRIQLLGILVALISGLVTVGLAFDKAAFLLIPLTIGLFGCVILMTYGSFFELAAAIRDVCDLGWEKHAKENIPFIKAWYLIPIAFPLGTLGFLVISSYLFLVSQQKTTLCFLNNWFVWPILAVIITILLVLQIKLFRSVRKSQKKDLANKFQSQLKDFKNSLKNFCEECYYES